MMTLIRMSSRESQADERRIPEANTQQRLSPPDKLAAASEAQGGVGTSYWYHETAVGMTYWYHKTAAVTGSDPLHTHEQRQPPTEHSPLMRVW